MEAKPIKRSEYIIQLSKDHHFTLLFCWKIRNGLKKNIDPDRIIKYVNYFWKEHMQPHFLDEETILFAPLKDVAVQKALMEHAAIAGQVNALDISRNDILTKLSLLAETVDNHVRYEERGLFPHLENTLTEQQLQDIGIQLAAHHNPALKDDFADEFWLNK